MAAFAHDVPRRLARAGDTIHLVSVVNNDRALPISTGATGSSGRTTTASMDDDFSYDKTIVRTLPPQHVPVHVHVAGLSHPGLHAMPRRSRRLQS
jgi:hypothetical protein